MRRGEIWWASLRDPVGSAPGYRRPVVIVQSDAFNRSRIASVIVAAVTSNLRLKDAPGNVHLPRSSSGLKRDSVINVSQLLSASKALLTERAGRLTPEKVRELDAGLRLVMAL
jgi:mRNA interferase MazF